MTKRIRGSSALRLVIAVAIVGVLILVLLLRRGSGVDRPAPVAPNVPGDASQHPVSPDGGTRTGAPDPTVPDVTPGIPEPVDGGWRVAGRVRARGGAAVADADVHVDAVIAGETRALGDAHTASDGSWTIAAPALGELDALSASLCQVSATVRSAHHAPGRASTAFDPKAVDRLVPLDVRLEPGERLTGRIVDTRTKAVSDANVRLTVANAKGGVTSWVLVQEATTDAAGRFDLGFASAAQYHLSARAEGVGTAFEMLELDAGVPRDLGDLVLAGGEPITGTVSHATGEPAAFFEVWAFDADYATAPDALALAVRRAVEVERGDGLTCARAWTDAAGKFELRGLRPGHYSLRSPDVRAVLEPHQARVEPGTKDIQLQLLSSTLVVRVRDEDGKPVRGANVRLSDLTTLADGTYEPGESRMATARGPEAAAVFCLDAEAPSVVDAYTSTRRSREEFLMLAQNEFVHEVVLVLPRVEAKGRIHLDVQGEDGLPLEKLQVTLLSAVTQTRREDLGVLETDGHGLLPPVPCGTYAMLVGYAPGFERDHFPVRSKQPVSVVATEPVNVSLRAHRGSHVDVSLELEGPPPAGFAVIPVAPGSTGRATSDEEQRARFGTSVVVSRSDGTPGRTLQFQIEGRGAPESRLLPGESATSIDLLETGACTLSLAGPVRWNSTDSALTLVPGETAKARITVRAR